jgi:GlpG protein
MRSIATFKEEKIALRFWNYLQGEGVESTLEEDDLNHTWLIWVLEEEKIPLAVKSYEEFKENPEDLKFKSVKANDAVPNNETFNIPKKKSRFQNYNLRDNWRKQERSPGMISLAFIITSVAVFLLSGMGKNAEIVNSFLITETFNGSLSEILNGEVWRLVTPIFLHFGLIHIFFNMYWLNDLGGQIEKKKGSRFISLFLLVTAIVSNLAQYKLGGPAFGGMSGVVYGLFGYVWIKSKFDPGDGLYIHQTTALIMLAWFFLCFAGIFPGVANWAHAGGLITGSTWGYISAVRWNRGS